jgi:uncharacterized protein with HEPN domain
VPRRWPERISDMLEAIRRIQLYTRGMEYETFAADLRTLDAVVRNITILGEAARRIAGEVRALSPGVPWDEMSGIRNVVVHEYFGVSLPMVWETVQNDLPPLIEPLQRLLDDHAGD